MVSSNSLLDLGVQRVVQSVETGQQHAVDLLHGGDVHGRGERVVGRLAHVDVVVRVHGRLAAQHATRQLNDAATWRCACLEASASVAFFRKMRNMRALS
uniref:Uncharacterized protein n=1 Tax=Phytophthora fragariae TaxID=53985 RepID=A0A6A3EX94_9STRA|nr:hypothetical protein PF009_g12096 [Phytophthora fragariae]